jgi:hypothetical protein
MAVGWIVLVLVFLGIFIFLKLSPGMRFGRTWTLVVGLLIGFFVITLGYVLSRPDVSANLSSFDGVMSALKIYVTWIGTIFNKATTISGNVINTDWTSNLTSSK